MGTTFSNDLDLISLVGILFVGISLFMVTFSSSLRIDRLESGIRGAIVRLDPALENYYINSLNELRKDAFEAPLAVVLIRIFSRYDNIVWFVALSYIIGAKLIKIYRAIP